jgi:L-glyceraldehyde 3-phosphate reductase
MDLGLKGKRVLITGGSKGIGRAAAEGFAAEGAHVAICARNADEVAATVAALKGMGVKALIHQPSYSMLNRWVECNLLDTLDDLGTGCIAFSPLAQGLLTKKYLNGVPSDARAAKAGSFNPDLVTEDNLQRIRGLNAIAEQRGQTLAQMAIAWVLRDPRVTSALVGARTVDQLADTLKALRNLAFSENELAAIDTYASDGGLNIWSVSSDL